MNTYTSDDIGVYFDGARGVYIGEAVQQLAASHGWKYSAQFQTVNVADTDSEGVWSANGETYNGAWDEAEQYLNDLTADGVWFGANESGDWGLWAVEDDS